MLLAVVLPFSGMVWLQADVFDVSPTDTWLDYGRVTLISWVLVAPALMYIRVYRLALYERTPRPLAAIFRFGLSQSSPSVWFLRFAVFIILALLLGSFTVFKSIIPELKPFK
ncbi:hypothetical protein F2Q65_11515 [Thiohalocapsa marina]|uniref:Uncharacterized protein n=1 Tax=Thiohalocapsa marina TaxID=424902 RepID=A0A5M8FIG8_9GAMM|nr:hypothetical protein [Thiohalocapsa marina]KAA6184718.1 hypothetical protein F2Q65_11515 [Thiohalocapsa marina]